MNETRIGNRVLLSSKLFGRNPQIEERLLSDRIKMLSYVKLFEMLRLILKLDSVIQNKLKCSLKKHKISLDMGATSPHDRFFRETWNVSLVRSFLEESLPPKMRSLICLEALAICKNSFIEPSMKEYYSAMLYQAELEGNPEFVYFLFGHKSSREKLIFLQLLRYMLSIWDLYIKQLKEPDRSVKLPIVIPLIVYHGKPSWNMPERFSQCFQDVNPDAHSLCA